jgi:hypothetical protein
MNQIAIMESKIEVLCKQVDDLKKDLALNASMLARQCDLAREAETQALRLGCCGNCKNNHITNIDTYCEITGEEVNSHKTCAKWKSDGLTTRRDRE